MGGATVRAGPVPGLAFDDTGVPYLELFLGFTVAVYLLHTYLDVRQLRVRAENEGPMRLQECCRSLAA